MATAIRLLLLAALVVALGGLAAAGFGAYDVGADAPHWPVTYRALETLKERSVRARSAGIAVPDLTDPALIRGGAGNYDAMCTGCHLAPGRSDTEISRGLYPQPPTWSELGQVDPRDAFWTIKHGLKLTGMPAWGLSMEDRYIWGLVALLGEFPRLTQADYDALVAASPGHRHGGTEGDTRDAPDPVEPAPHPHDDETTDDHHH